MRQSIKNGGQHMHRWIALAAVAAAASYPARAQPVPPPARPHFDHVEGVKISDEYRWMETAGVKLDPWINAEDAHARKTLDSLPGRKSLEKRIAELWRTGMGKVDETLIDEQGEQRLFMEYSLNRPRLGVRTNGGPLSIVFDSEGDGPEKGASLRRSAIKLSPNGRFVTLGFVERGEDRPRLRILDLATRQLSPETLHQPLWADADGFYIEWLPDSSGFLWARNPLRTAATPDGEREFNGHIYLHRLGTLPAADTLLFGPTVVSGLRPDDTPYPGLSADGRWIVIRERHVEGRSLWVAPFARGQATAPFRKVVASSGSIAGWGVDRDTLWAVVPEGSPTHSLLRIPLEAPNVEPQQVATGQDGVLSGLAVARDAIYVSQRDGAVSSVWRIDEAGKREAITLPRPGVIDRLETRANDRGARLRLRSGLHPDEWLDILPEASSARAVLAPPVGLPPALTSLAVSILQAPARDGTLVPVSLLHKKDQQRDRRGLVRLETYGCFGSSREFFYDPSNLAWLERGGMLAIVHVRGGSELGRSWHEANVARGHATGVEDTVDAVEHLVREGWIAPGRAALVGTSCGAATAGNAALSRPDLISAASLHVGGVDEWRGWSETASGARSILDIGDPKTAVGVRRIVAASPYHRLLRGVRQPAFFLLNGGTDYTIPLWMGAKFLARARATAGAGSGPLLFRVEREAGHSGPTDFDSQLRAHTDDLAFQLWQLGHPDFQPSAPKD